jgi:DNA-directed RNA polymerase subunit RPC12/RpoP
MTKTISTVATAVRMSATCPKCGASMTAPSDWNGRHVKCPKCQGDVQLAGPPPPPVEEKPALPITRKPSVWAKCWSLGQTRIPGLLLAQTIAKPNHNQQETITHIKLPFLDMFRLVWQASFSLLIISPFLWFCFVMGRAALIGFLTGLFEHHAAN